MYEYVYLYLEKFAIVCKCRLTVHVDSAQTPITKKMLKMPEPTTALRPTSSCNDIGEEG